MQRLLALHCCRGSTCAHPIPRPFIFTAADLVSGGLSQLLGRLPMGGGLGVLQGGLRAAGGEGAAACTGQASSSMSLKHPSIELVGPSPGLPLPWPAGGAAGRAAHRAVLGPCGGTLYNRDSAWPHPQPRRAVQLQVPLCCRGAALRLMRLLPPVPPCRCSWLIGSWLIQMHDGTVHLPTRRPIHRN